MNIKISSGEFSGALNAMLDMPWPRERTATAICLVLFGFGAMVCTSKDPPSPPTGGSAPVGLAVTASKPEFPQGEVIALQITRTNTQGSACMLSRVPAGAVTVLSLTRDGIAVTPSTGTASFYRDFSSYLVENLISVSPGGKLELTLSSDPAAPPGAALPVAAPNGRGGAEITWWPVGAPGIYQITLGYLQPPLRGGPEDPCSTAMEQATSTFIVKAR